MTIQAPIVLSENDLLNCFISHNEGYTSVMIKINGEVKLNIPVEAGQIFDFVATGESK